MSRETCSEFYMFIIDLINNCGRFWTDPAVVNDAVVICSASAIMRAMEVWSSGPDLRQVGIFIIYYGIKMQEDEGDGRIEFTEEVFFGIYEETFMEPACEDIIAYSLCHFQVGRFFSFVIELEEGK